MPTLREMMDMIPLGHNDEKLAAGLRVLALSDSGVHAWTEGDGVRVDGEEGDISEEQVRAMRYLGWKHDPEMGWWESGAISLNNCPEDVQ